MATTSIGAPGVVFPDGTTQDSAAGTPVVRIYTSPSPWTKQTGLKSIKVTVMGGGGGSVGNKSGADGGFGGAAIGYFPAPGVTPVTVTVGAGGACGPRPGGPSAVPGSAGGTSSFGGLLSATGGAGGNPSVAANTAGGTGPGTTTSTIISLDAGTSNADSGFSLLGMGRFGSLPAPVSAPYAGIPGSGFGAAGSAGSSPTAGTTNAGGNGSPGIVIVEEFY